MKLEIKISYKDYVEMIPFFQAPSYQDFPTACREQEALGWRAELRLERERASYMAREELKKK